MIPALSELALIKVVLTSTLPILWEKNERQLKSWEIRNAWSHLRSQPQVNWHWWNYSLYQPCLFLMKFFRENTCLVEVEKFFSILDLSLDDIPGFFLDPNPVSSVFKFQFLPTSIPISAEIFFSSPNLNLSLETRKLAMLMSIMVCYWL